jgi:phage RecT family recombinase
MATDQMGQFLALVEQRRAVIDDALGALAEPTKRRFVTLAIRAIRDHQHRDGTVCRCTATSYFQVIIDACQCMLELGTVDDLAYLIPYGTELTLRPSYKGMIKRVIDAKVADHIYAEVVRKKDFRRFKSGEKRELLHRFDPFDLKRGEIVGSYSYATLSNGIKDWEALSLDDIEAIKGAAKRTGKGRLGPAWQAFEEEMLKKSAMRRHMKRLQGQRRIEGAAGAQLAATLNLDNKDFEFETTATPVREEFDGDTTIEEVRREPKPVQPEPEPSPKPEPPKEKLVLEPEKPKEPEDRFLDLAEQMLVESTLVQGWLSREWPKVLKELAGVDSIDQIKVSKLRTLIAALEQAGAARKEAPMQ